ncbi:MAG: uracil-DNA glycosylase [Pedococcus sp.]
MTEITQAQIEWALRYDGYKRLASTPEQLEKLISDARTEFRAEGEVPEWCGVDFLHGWAFYLVRADRHMGGGTLGREWSAVLERVRSHSASGAADRPPDLFRTEEVVLPTTFSTVPKMHKDSAFLAAKQARWWESHVAPVNQLVDQVRADIAAQWADEHGDQAAPVFVPYIDPDSGGVAARVLFLLESPAGPAALGSRMLSADNNDETAKNVWLGYEESGMPRTFGLHWNAVPWYVGDGKKNRGVTTAQVEQGRRYLDQLLDHAPSVRVILALGKPAQASIAPAEKDLRDRGIVVLKAPHPSPILAASTRGKSLVEFNAAVAEAYRIARDSDQGDAHL